MLFVCTANICRSPAAEHLARHRVRPGAPFAFASAGFLREGVPCPDRLIELLARRGVDASAHRSHVIDLATIEAADLILTMEVGHVREVATLDGRALGKTVPVRELDRWLTAPRSIDEVREHLAAREPARYLAVQSTDDVPDPYGRSARAYRTAVELIDDLVGRLVTNLHP